VTYRGPVADIGVIGGSGFYSFFDSDPGTQAAEEVTVETPFGPPSGPLTIGQVAGRSVAFVPRHGVRHQFPPHRVNYRANLWALRAVGVRQVLGPCAVGSLRPDLGPGSLVVPDQVVDRTSGRASTYYDEPGHVVHVAFADPYCPHGRAAVLRAAADSKGGQPVDGGTLVVINGPRFSTRAESLWHRAQGWTVVGMTGAPEAALARELSLCYTAIALVTDHDAGLERGDGVTHDEVLRVFGENIAGLRALLTDVIGLLPPRDDDCTCRHALDGLTLPFPLP
jgi:5'-methylthioadenosine phosphorylase